MLFQFDCPSLTIQPFIVSIRKLVLVTLDLIHASVGKLLDSVSEEVGSTPRRQWWPAILSDKMRKNWWKTNSPTSFLSRHSFYFLFHIMWCCRWESNRPLSTECLKLHHMATSYSISLCICIHLPQTFMSAFFDRRMRITEIETFVGKRIMMNRSPRPLHSCPNKKVKNRIFTSQHE